jgi:hypothetical protein
MRAPARGVKRRWYIGLASWPDWRAVNRYTRKASTTRENAGEGWRRLG